MLDASIRSQLESVYAPIDQTIVLSMRPSQHPKQGELRELLTDLAAVNPYIELREEGAASDIPSFRVLRGEHSTGICFDCIPGGHEFTSLVLAVLNAAGHGRMPDAGLQKRVQALAGPIEITSYISLSCTNCPDVVQALDQMALIHGNMRHVIVDGGLVPEEIERLGIRGVPAVFAGETLLHSGRSDFGSLLDKLEEHFAADDSDQGVAASAAPGSATPGAAGDAASAAASVGSSAGGVSSGAGRGGAGAAAANGAAAPNAAVADAAAASAPQQYDVLVLGGGPAGASAAIYSARKGLRTAVIAKKVGGQVNDTKGIQNLISVPYIEGPQLSAQLRAHMDEYPIDVLENRSILRVDTGSADSWGAEKQVHVRGGEVFAAPTLIVATGAAWRELGVPGETEYIGRGVAFCPHCDGPFFAGRHTAVIGGGNSGVEAAIDLAGTCSRVTLFEFADSLNADTVLQQALARLSNVEVVTSARTTEILGDGAQVTGIRWEDRATGQLEEAGLDGVFVQIGLLPNSDVVADSLSTNRHGEITVDDHCRTSVPGVYAAGDVSTAPYKQIVAAMGQGAAAALAAFEDRVRAGAPVAV